ncbi:uncharacterized mitochondrial protein AtMg00820-like [Benincasa hispida]|uniref:uncharacterized mitochondrial protein AtMg00820-like n=1 Tax=Benincasa hispida TaxID=102211 RepID=UPI00190266A6|nr:uncharacterized mitochondrial protein AtMg00820-like [Benincasa hispida]
MITRSKSRIFKPKALLAIVPSTSPTIPIEPPNYKVALADPQWKQVMVAEYEALIRNNTWSLVPLPPKRKAIRCKWAFHIKLRLTSELEHYKARLVAQGHTQEFGIDYFETFNPVIFGCVIWLEC